MSEQIGSYDAKTKLPQILRRVKEGEAFTITNRGLPVADIIPSRTNERIKAEIAINNILKTKRYFVSDDDLKDLKESGRK